MAVGGLEKKREGGRTDGRTREVQRTLPRPAYPHRACNCNCNSRGQSRRSRESTERLPARRLYTYARDTYERVCFFLFLKKRERERRGNEKERETGRERTDTTLCSDRGNNRTEEDRRRSGRGLERAEKLLPRTPTPSASLIFHILFTGDLFLSRCPLSPRTSWKKNPWENGPGREAPLSLNSSEYVEVSSSSYWSFLRVHLRRNFSTHRIFVF